LPGKIGRECIVASLPERKRIWKFEEKERDKLGRGETIDELKARTLRIVKFNMTCVQGR